MQILVHIHAVIPMKSSIEMDSQSSKLIKNYSYSNVTCTQKFHNSMIQEMWTHDDVIKWRHFPRYWSFARGNHRPPVNSPHKGQWRGALTFSLICVWINGWSKQSWGWWFETSSRPLWRHRRYLGCFVEFRCGRAPVCPWSTRLPMSHWDKKKS